MYINDRLKNINIKKLQLAQIFLLLDFSEIYRRLRYILSVCVENKMEQKELLKNLLY